MEPLPTQTLLGLLRMYDTAITDLRAMRDPAVAKFIDRLALHRVEVVAALQPSSPHLAPEMSVGGDPDVAAAD